MTCQVGWHRRQRSGQFWVRRKLYGEVANEVVMVMRAKGAGRGRRSCCWPWGEQVAGRGLRVAVADRSRKSQWGRFKAVAAAAVELGCLMSSWLSFVRSGKKEGE